MDMPALNVVIEAPQRLRRRGPWDEDLMQARIEEMGDVCKRLPLGKTDRPSTQCASWPEVVREIVESYGYNRDLRVRIRPSSAEIGRFEEVIHWISMLDPTNRAIVWGFALGMSLRKIERALGRLPGCRTLTKSNIPNRYRRCLQLLAYHCNAAGRPVDDRSRMRAEEIRRAVESPGQTGQISGSF